MAQLRQEFSEFEKLNTKIIVVGPEGAQSFKKYWEENHLPFIGLPDPRHTVLKRYGQEVNLFKLGRMPAQVIIDQHGIVRFIHYGHSMSDIPSNKETLEIIESLSW